MNDTVKKWLLKSEEDYKGVKALLALGDSAFHSLICFHAQQCIEKLLKALLISHGQLVSKTHNLTELNSLICDIIPTWELPLEALDTLTVHAVASRYPESFLGEEEASEALEICRRLRERVQGEFER